MSWPGLNLKFGSRSATLHSIDERLYKCTLKIDIKLFSLQKGLNSFLKKWYKPIKYDIYSITNVQRQNCDSRINSNHMLRLQRPCDNQNQSTKIIINSAFIYKKKMLVYTNNFFKILNWTLEFFFQSFLKLLLLLLLPEMWEFLFFLFVSQKFVDSSCPARRFHHPTI